MTSLANSQRVAIRVSWSQKTCYPPDQDQWSEKNPSLGQCAVTALLVQDLVGGNILFDA